MSESRAVAVREPGALPAELSVEDVLVQVEKIQTLMKRAMLEGEHYGAIPGTGGKKTLLKPGAEKLCLMFQFAPEYRHEITPEPFTVISNCTLVHRPSGTVVATGSGMCSAHESKYRWRKADRTCPKCGKAGTVIKGQAQYGGGWLCWQKKEGCGAKFPDGAKEIEGQQTGRVENPDIADQFNTVLKMADKRALVAAVLNGTAASDIFTQDLEDIQENLQQERSINETAPEPEPPKPAAGKPETARRATPEKKPDKVVETTAQPLSEAPIADNAIPKEMPPIPDGARETDQITAAHAIWLVAEAKACGALISGVLKSFARKEVTDPSQVNYAEFKVMAGTLKRRRERAEQKED